MPLVTIEAVFMAANVKTSTFDGKEKTSLYIDLYQADSPDTEKSLQVKAEDLSILNDINKNYAMGSKFKCLASVNAYKNKAYYKLVNIAKTS